MDPLHELATRIGLAATERFGFALAGGYAVQAHGFLNRRSEDVDLFTSAGGDFDTAVVAAVAAYRDAGLKVEMTLENPGFARLLITDGDSRSVKIEMGVDWRPTRRSGLRSVPCSILTTRWATRSPHCTAELRSGISSTCSPSCAAAATTPVS
jgi:hypothetical protein